MHHIRRLFIQPSQVNETVAVVDGKPRLPAELLMLIGAFVEYRSDLVNLCRGSRNFNNIFTPMLYTVISINTTQMSIQRQFALYRILQNPGWCLFVTSFSIKLNSLSICSKVQHLGGPLPTWFYRCSCDSYDLTLGNIILSMDRLQSLTLDCRLCTGMHSHSYLLQLNPPLLQQFTFRCLRGPHDVGVPTFNEEILGALFMSRIEELAIESQVRGWSPNLHTNSLEMYDATKTAPRLHTLSHDGGILASRLLRNRPIQRLCLYSARSPVGAPRARKICEEILASPGKLSHLFTLNILNWLPKAITRDPSPYLSLRFIGTINLPPYRPAVRSFYKLEMLAPLVNLEGIEINRETDEDTEQTSQPMDARLCPPHISLRLLSAQFLLLRRVLHTPRPRSRPEAYTNGGHSYLVHPPILEAVLWEKTDIKWKSRFVPYLEYWDILHDKMERI